MRRVWGVVGSLGVGKTGGANTTTPASAQIVMRLCWWDPTADKYRSTFVRVGAYAASISPRLVSGFACNLRIGDIVTGVLERPNSLRNSASLSSWDFGSVEEWVTFSPFAWFETGMYNATAADTYDLPQLGGCHFAPPPASRLSDVSLLTIASPPVSNREKRAISARTGNIAVAASEIASRASLARNRFFGCPCERCNNARSLLALNPRPSPPEIAPLDCAPPPLCLGVRSFLNRWTTTAPISVGTFPARARCPHFLDQ